MKARRPFEIECKGEGEERKCGDGWTMVGNGGRSFVNSLFCRLRELLDEANISCLDVCCHSAGWTTIDDGRVLD